MESSIRMKVQSMVQPNDEGPILPLFINTRFDKKYPAAKANYLCGQSIFL